ncbi:MAG: phosphate ABC transporter substrate-binding protein PstS, partial [Dolichospermum sp.]
MTFLTSVLMNRFITTSLLTGAVTLSPVLSTMALAQTLNGAGATFPAPLYEKYAREVRKKYPDLKVN